MYIQGSDGAPGDDGPAGDVGPPVSWLARDAPCEQALILLTDHIRRKNRHRAHFIVIKTS